MSVLHFHMPVTHKHSICFSGRLEIWAWELNNVDTSPCNKTRLWNKHPGFGVTPKKMHLPRGSHTKNLQQHQTQGSETLSSLPCSSSTVPWANKDQGISREDISYRSFFCLSPDRFRCTEKVLYAAAAECQAANYSQPTRQSTFINALLDTPKHFQCTGISVAISALPRQMLGAWCEHV